MLTNELATVYDDKPLIDFSWEDCFDVFFAHEDEKFFFQYLH